MAPRAGSSSTKRSESLAALQNAVSDAQAMLRLLLLALSARRGRATAAEARAVRVHRCLLASVAQGEHYHGDEPRHNCDALDVGVQRTKTARLPEKSNESAVHEQPGFECPDEGVNPARPLGLSRR